MREPVIAARFRAALPKTSNQLALRSSCERWEIAMTLEKMSTGELQSLRAEVEAMIATKVAARRQELETQLSELLHINGIGNGSRGGKTRSVAAKYRNPKNADEVWSGRGRMPLWLGAEIKAGKDREDFLIG
jgi:DNA-binding protein H-NS